MTITRKFVLKFASQYDDPYDSRVFGDLAERIRERGCYDLNDLIEVGRWKAGRATGYLRRNTDDDVRAITSLAFGAPDHLKARVLAIMHGVQQPMASALLTVWDPERFTVYDVRAMATLAAHGLVDSSWLDYSPYLDLCRSLAKKLKVDLRTLDRALYKADGQLE